MPLFVIKTIKLSIYCYTLLSLKIGFLLKFIQKQQIFCSKTLNSYHQTLHRYHSRHARRMILKILPTLALHSMPRSGSET